MMGYAKFEVEGDIMPAFSKPVNSFLKQAMCLRGNVYSFWSMGSVFSLVIGIIWIKTVLSMSVECLEKMSVYLSHSLYILSCFD